MFIKKMPGWLLPVKATRQPEGNGLVEKSKTLH
jgi:hypothetical protein